jgi:hypothetical protein
MSDFATDRSVNGSPKVEPQVIKNSYSSETASPRVTPNVVINPEFQASAKQHNTNDKERNHVVEAQKQISSQATVGVLPQEENSPE